MFNEKRAVAHLMDLLRLEGPSGGEGAVARCVRDKLIAAGCRPSWIRHDRAHRKNGTDGEVGNLIVKIPGTVKAPRLLFSSHLDTVPLCRGAVPMRRGNRIVAKGDTAVGADNRTAVGALVTLAETVLKQRSAHPPLTLLFTVSEEIGLQGSRWVDVKDLGKPAFGVNIDSGAPAKLVMGAVGADRWHAEVFGVSSHAGVHPEDGVSAHLIVARALSKVAARGFFGRVRKRAGTGTSNVGSVSGGEATNQVTDYAVVRGESRSHDAEFLRSISAAYREAFEESAVSVSNARGETGRVKFHLVHDYPSFRLDDDAAILKLAERAARSLRYRPQRVISDGGLDANQLNGKGVPTVTIGAGQHNAHTLREYADIKEYLGGCRLALTIASMAQDGG